MAELVSIFCVSERTMCLLIMPQIQHHICMGNYCYFLITSETEKATCSCIMIRNRLIVWFSHIFFMRPMRKWHHQNWRRFHFNHLKNTSFLFHLAIFLVFLTFSWYHQNIRIQLIGLIAFLFNISDMLSNLFFSLFLFFMKNYFRLDQ